MGSESRAPTAYPKGTTRDDPQDLELVVLRALWIGRIAERRIAPRAPGAVRGGRMIREIAFALAIGWLAGALAWGAAWRVVPSAYVAEGP